MAEGARPGVPPGLLDSAGTDGYIWISHAQEMAAKGKWRLKHTDFDNAPEGRQMHWNSGFAWWLILLGWIDHLIAGVSLSMGIAAMAIWANPLIFAAFLITSALTVNRRCGGWVASFFLIATISCSGFSEGFRAAYPDHHGLHNAAIVFCLFGLFFGGAGWIASREVHATSGFEPPREPVARRWFILSALSGAVGLWVSAFTLTIILVGIGLGAAAAIVFARLHRGQLGKFSSRPELWRLWGIWGASASIAFYLLEYFPGHLGFRLEVNHPLYALAWLGGSELLCRFQRAVVNGRRPRTVADWLAVTSSCAVILALPLTLWLGGSTVYLPFDPLLFNLHKEIIEFLPARQFVIENGISAFVLLTFGLALCLATSLGLLLSRFTPVWIRLLMMVGGGAAVSATGMYLLQVRWGLAAASVAVAIAPLAGAGLITLWNGRSTWFRLAPLAVASGLLLSFFPRSTVWDSWQNVRSSLAYRDEGLRVLFRDIAQFLRTLVGPEGRVVLLSSPNSSISIAYFGKFRTIGTLYWENRDGLAKAASIFNAPTQEDALRLIEANGITHIVFVDVDNFLFQYYKLQHPASSSNWTKAFGARSLLDLKLPVWARVLPYQLPEKLANLKCRPLVIEVAPDQSKAEALLNAGNYCFLNARWDEAILNFRAASAEDPGSWLAQWRLGQALARSAKADDAAAQFGRAIELAPPNDQGRLAFEAGMDLAKLGSQQIAAAKFLRESAKTAADNPSPKNNLAWLLATSPDDRVRDGTEALRLAEAALTLSPQSPITLDTLGAARAEMGNFHGAVEAATQALNNLGSAPDASLQAEIKKHIEAYKASKPWRETVSPPPASH